MLVLGRGGSLYDELVMRSDNLNPAKQELKSRTHTQSCSHVQI